ncbi:MAG: DUF1653 domain-containing protein [Mobilitalea sp.]
MDKARIPKPGEIYNHFKNRLYQIITVAVNTETGELMVVYQALYGDFKTYVRPIDMFMSEVDHKKYPEVKQKYRFERRILEESSKDTSVKTVKQEPLESMPVKEEPTIAAVHKTEDELNNKAQAPITPKEGEVNSLIMEFLDADSYARKLEIIQTNLKKIDNRIVNDMAVALDCTIDEGPLEERIQGITTCLLAKGRFEDKRLR